MLYNYEENLSIHQLIPGNDRSPGQVTLISMICEDRKNCLELVLLFLPS